MRTRRANPRTGDLLSIDPDRAFAEGDVHRDDGLEGDEIKLTRNVADFAKEEIVARRKAD